MTMIAVKDLSFSYEDSYDLIFDKVSFLFDTDWRLGFVGRNGRGKTTFCKLLLGEYAYSGTIQAGIRFQYFPFPVREPSRIALEIMQELCPAGEDWELLREASLLEVEAEALYRPFETLSEGERTKVLLAALFLGTDKFLLLDEPTNHLDEAARRKIGAYLQKKKGFLLISHDRELLDSCTDHILSINRTDISVQQGNFSAWWQNRQQQDAFELAENDRLKKEIHRLGQAAKRSAEWSDQVERSKFGQTNSGSKLDRGFVGHKAAKLMNRAKQQERRVKAAAEEKSRLLHNVEQAQELKLMPLSYPKETLICGKELSLFYRSGIDPQPGGGLVKVCSGISFSLERGMRLAVSGKNGCGKSTLLKLICGENIDYQGMLQIGSGLKISRVTQDTSHLQGSLWDYAERLGISESLLKAMLRKLGFERQQFEKELTQFSEGQKKKVLLAGSLCQPAHLYVWDEPLNFIDVISRMQIEELLLQYEPTLLFVEHDAAFRKRIATSELVLT